VIRQPRGTNGTAIAALILSFALPFVGAILGFVARSQIRRTGEGGDGLAVAAIVIGLLWTAGNLILLLVMFR